MIVNCREIRTGGQRSGILPIIALLILSMTAGCSQSNPNQGRTSEQLPQAQEAASTPQTQPGKTKVVATFLPIYLFTKAVAGDVADVEILVPPGTEVHEYQATPGNVKAIATANVLVKNGLGLEEFLEGTVKNAQNPKLTEIDASIGIKPLNEISPVVKTTQDEKDHNHAQGNPHVWLDPVLAKQQVTNIRDGLIAADPANKATYKANATAYIKELESLNSEFKQTLQKNSSCTFITFHDAFPYLAKRYNLKQVAVVEIPEDQLSPTDVQNAINAVKQYKVKALFSEPGVDNKLLTSLSKDLKLNLRTLDSLENGETDPQHYFKAMKANLQTLETACK
ncbi:metal ABC transporter substrate-binding protein [Nostoc sp. DedQUE03]|uniref:metal ABC transporter substrate-binding protein n=1 Tax=Nostoc sp. DedQUE03 TaxID=3075389 RepID=UPI002AD42284|nr:metal ABC transporter substrate-binding protein [Nostoc sp. DedQUE03]MDZ7974466.1 metal ABC transporter substrate-binding protein [Nostoc sp. DedQUE03]MDZ8047130.1 metal ABC transporter substrate-binding protein [Nostoc sp. DedQUE02]